MPPVPAGEPAPGEVLPGVRVRAGSSVHELRDTAARLEQMTVPGSVLISPATWAFVLKYTHTLGLEGQEQPAGFGTLAAGSGFPSV